MSRGNDERFNGNRRPPKPGEELGMSMADIMKQMVYDSEFNDIVGLPNDIVAEPDEEENNG